MNTLESDLCTWELVMKEDWMSVLPSKWAFRIKWFPDVLIKKCKAQFCVRSDLQKEGIYYFKSWSPVVQWTTGHTMMILAANIASSLTRQMSQLPCTCWACHQWAHPCRSNSWLPPWPKHGLETQEVSLRSQVSSPVFLQLHQRPFGAQRTWSEAVFLEHMPFCW